MTVVLHGGSQITRSGRDPLMIMSLNLFCAFILSVIETSNKAILLLAGNKTSYNLEI